MNDYNQPLILNLRAVILNERYSPWSIANLAGVNIDSVLRICRGYFIGSKAPELHRISWAFTNRSNEFRKTMINFSVRDFGSSVVAELPIADVALKDIVADLKRSLINLSPNELRERAKLVRDEIPLNKIASIGYMCDSSAVSKFEAGKHPNPVSMMCNLLLCMEEDLTNFFSPEWAPSAWKGKTFGPGNMLRRMRRFHNIPSILGAKLVGLHPPELSNFEIEESEPPQELLDRAAEIYGFPSEMTRNISAMDCKAFRPASEYLTAWSEWVTSNHGTSGALPLDTQNQILQIERRKSL